MDEKRNENLKRLQRVNCEMLKMCIALCEKHQLAYYVIGGTLLGAVRHGGFIPWDDDIDVGMPRPDYEKFLQLAKNELPEGFRLRTIDMDDEYRTYFVKIENMNVSLRREYYSKDAIVKKEIFAWIDILPIDGAPEGETAIAEHVKKIKRSKQMLSFSLLDKCMGAGKKRSKKQMLLMKFGLKTGIYKCLNTHRLFLRFDHICKKYSFDTAKVLGNSYGLAGVREFVNREIFGRGAELEFENIRIRVPENYDAYLRHVYGDYMQLPPEEERCGHWVEFVD